MDGINTIADIQPGLRHQSVSCMYVGGTTTLVTKPIPAILEGVAEGKAEEMEHSNSMVTMTFLKQIEDTKLDKKEYISKT